MFYPRLLLAAAADVLYHVGLVSPRIHNLAYLRTYRHVALKDIEARGRELFENVICRAFIPGTMNLLERHVRDGTLIVIVSATTCQILEPAVRAVQPDFALCTGLAVDNCGRCTGYPQGDICIGEEKAKQVKALALEQDIDLSSSFAYSDHHADLPLLEAVGFPAAVNPTPRLLKLAKSRQWPVHRFF